MTEAMKATRLVGILNLTPDSFSDGGRYQDPDAVMGRARCLIEEGADVLDIGAESTRPDAQPVTPDSEWERLAPYLASLVALCHSHRVEVSLDTRHWQVAERGLASGVDWINDVSGLRDDRMLDVLRGAACKVVFMHALSIPVKSGETLPRDLEVVPFLIGYAQRERDRLVAAGIRAESLIFDPGIGFGKDFRQTMQIIASSGSFKKLSMPLLFGHSRKRFMQHFTSVQPSDRDDVTATLSTFLMLQSVDYLRVHAVGKHATIRSVLMGKV